MAGVTLTTNGSPWLLSELQALTRPPIASPTDRKALARAVAPPRALGDRGKPARKGASAAGCATPMYDWLRLAYIMSGRRRRNEIEESTGKDA